jgi:hypothetical protein
MRRSRTPSPAAPGETKGIDDRRRDGTPLSARAMSSEIPEQAKRGGSTLRHRQGKPGRCGKMRLASCRDFRGARRGRGLRRASSSMAGMPKGRVPGWLSIPGRLLQGPQALA